MNYDLLFDIVMLALVAWMLYKQWQQDIWLQALDSQLFYVSVMTGVDKPIEEDDDENLD